jgi:prepilin-type N-terminal cleavage/methylation domain-containing protein
MSRIRRAVQGFTLVEIMIVAVIFSMIALTLVYIFRANMLSWRWGQSHMEFNQKVQLAMKQVFTDIKRINPIVVMDEGNNLWFQGEKIGDLFPNLVEIINKDNELANGGEEIIFQHTSYSDPGKRVQIRLYLEEGALMREITDGNGKKNKVVISSKVSDLHFYNNPLDIYEVRVAMTIADDRNPKLVENLSFVVHLDTHLVCIVVKTE